MQGIADFLSGIWGVIELTALAAAVGGLVWIVFVLRTGPLAAASLARAQTIVLVKRALAVVAGGGAAFALAQTGHLAADFYLLRVDLGRWPVSEYPGTALFQGGVPRIFLAVTLAAAALWLRRDPARGARWAATGVLAVFLAASGAWLTHAETRFENRGVLMVLTTVHAVAAVVWVGGIIQFIVIWRLIRGRPDLVGLWPVLLRRFGAVGIASSAVLLITAVPLAWLYVGSLRGLIGTSYGVVASAKIPLMLTALAFAAYTHRAVRRTPDDAAIYRRAPVHIEIEAGVLIVVLALAASLASQPAAVDVRPHDVATWKEVAEVFTPKWPRLETPDNATVAANRTDRFSVVDIRRSEPENNWSNFSHNVSGVFVAGISLVGLIGFWRRHSWTRHWPLGFVLLALFIFLRGSGGVGTWPFGPVSFWHALTDAENLQHRIAAVLALGLGLAEWRARARQSSESRLPYMMPVLGLAGAILLGMHTHVLSNIKSVGLIQASHTAISLLAVFMACGRWLELRDTSGVRRAAGLASLISLLLIGLVLIFYREPVV